MPQEYNITKRDFFIENHTKLRDFLARYLSSDVLMVGYDPLWDHAIGTIFPAIGQDFWYINEDDETIFPTLPHRGSQSIIGGEGSYNRFMQSLHWHIQHSLRHKQSAHESIPDMFTPARTLPSLTPLTPSVPLAETINDAAPQPIPVPPTTPESNNGQHKKVCIFHSQKDKRYLEQLTMHFQHFQREGLVDIWDETKITAGDKWKNSLRIAIETAQVAILLVSAEFLASDFIAQDVLPPLLEAANARGMSIIPVVLSYCVYEDTPLAPFHTFNTSPTKPLSTLRNAAAKDKIWVDLVRHVVHLIKIT